MEPPTITVPPLPEDDDLDHGEGASKESSKGRGLIPLVHLQVAAARRVPPLKVRGKDRVFHLLPAQPTKRAAAKAALDVVAAAVLGDRHLTDGAGL